VRNRIGLVLGGVAVAGAALYRAIRPQRRPPEPIPAPDPRADELRAKLEESRSVVAEREEFEGAETPVDLAAEVAPDLGERRRAVHERGRQVAEEMRRPGSDA
jgi:hypothetical protein